VGKLLRHDGDTFARTHEQLTGKKLGVARVELSRRRKHLLGTLPQEKVREMLAKEQAQRARELALAAERKHGKFAPGARKARAEAIREALKRTGQIALFSTAKAEKEQQPPPRMVGKRFTIGDRAEKQLAAVIEHVGKTLPRGKPLKLWNVSLSGPYVRQQRAIRAIDRGKRVILAQGVGSGKSVMSIGAFAHLHSQGKVKRALFAVPSVVQGQFGGEMGRYTKPGAYKYHAKPGAARDERLAAYRDPDNHMTVVTHQALRDDGLHLMQKHLGIGADEFSRMSRAQRAAAIRDAFTKEGIDIGMMVLDEGHDALNRQGKPDSNLARVLDAIADNTEYYVPMTANPLKNDVSEVFDWLSKLDPKRYPPHTRDEFMAKYGNNTIASREALQREVAPFFYSDRIELPVRAERRVENVTLSTAQQAAYREVQGLYDRARAARSRGKVDVDAIRQLSPSAFDKAPEKDHEAIAKRLSAALGMLRETAWNRVVNTHAADQNAKTQRVIDLARNYRNAGKPGVVFAHNRAAVDQLSTALKGVGLRVGVITGANSAKEKQAVQLGFNPEAGERTYDVLVCSDAGAVGMNAQSGKWLVNFDTPDTSKTHEQRNGRIHRIGQNDDVTIHDLVSDTQFEARQRKRLKTKYAMGDIFQSPTEALDDTGLAHFIASARAAQSTGKAIVGRHETGGLAA